ncbi:MAG: hypothetical protein M3O22_00965 [Pseudomonadota bacterium]|nr:hypothetical protein [Pseudomonadota bacterium]
MTFRHRLLLVVIAILLAAGILFLASRPLSAADSQPLRYEACTKAVGQKPVAGESGCTNITLTHSCSGPRHVILCSHTAGTQNCQMSDTPIPPDTALAFKTCLSGNSLTRHAACRTAEGCNTFAQKKPAR